MHAAPDWSEIINEKYRRAREHSIALATWIEQWRDQNNPHSFSAQRDSETGLVTLHVAINDWPGIKVSAMLGDWINNLRSILDFMVVHLWERGPTDISARHNASFPMARDAKQWERRMLRAPGSKCETCNAERRIGQVYGVEPAAQAVIQKHQPYFATGKFDACHPLASIVEISNADKHNGVFPITLAHIEAIALTTPDHPEPRPWFPSVTNTDTQYFPMALPAEAAEMYMSQTLSLEPRLEFSKQHAVFISSTILQVNQWVAQVVADLRPFLGAPFSAAYPQPLLWSG